MAYIDPKEETPDIVSPEIAAMAVEWAPIRTLLCGTRAMRENGTLYLPRHPAESDGVYTYRKNVSTLFNAFRKTVEKLAAKPFSEPLRLGDDMPEQIKLYCEDIDLEGRNLQAFAHDVFAVALAYGLSHILVDYPQMPEGQTLADQRVSGARPYFVHIRPDQILGWRSERIAGVETLTQLRIIETVVVPVGRWGTAAIQQVRVLEPHQYEIYRLDPQRKQWYLYETGPVSIGLIPLATVYGDRLNFMVARPPLLDLAYMNIEHWQSSSDQSNILHVARVPILFASGFAEGELKIGAGVAVQNEDPTAKLMYVEHTGAAIEAGRESLKDLEERMSLFGAQLLIKVPGTRTATETAINSAEAESVLSLIALNLQDALEFALNFAAKWENIDNAGSVQLFHDFGEWDDGMSGLDQLLKANEMSVLSYETTFHELQRRDVVRQELTWAEELDRIKAEGPRVGISGSFETFVPGGAPGAGTTAPATLDNASVTSKAM